MKRDLLFDFTVSRENKTIQVNREFDAPLQLVWKAWTTSELLDQWWGPQPWRAETKIMDFRENDHWCYSMVGPKGQRHCCILRYDSIRSEQYFTARDAFCDEEGHINTAFSQSMWDNQFEDQGAQTLVHITVIFDTLIELDQIIEMGFQEGFTMGLNQLDDLLTRQSKMV